MNADITWNGKKIAAGKIEIKIETPPEHEPDPVVPITIGDVQVEGTIRFEPREISLFFDCYHFHPETRFTITVDPISDETAAKIRELVEMGSITTFSYLDLPVKGLIKCIRIFPSNCYTLKEMRMELDVLGK